MAAFVVVSGPRVGTRFVLSESKQRVGRDSRCEIHLDDSETSRKHAEIELVDGAFLITDLKSSNGTLVNGHVIESKKLRDGDRVQIGKYVFVFRLHEAQPHSSDEDYLKRSVSIVSDESQESSQIVSRADLSDPVGETEFFDPELANPNSIKKSHWEIMYRTSLAVSRTLDINQLLEQIIDLIFQWVQCDHACVMLSDVETGELSPVYRKNRRPQSTHQITISKTILDYVLKKEEGVMTSDAKDDRRWSSSASIEASGVCEAICVPMRGRYGIVGVLYIDTIVNAKQQSAINQFNVFNDEHSAIGETCSRRSNDRQSFTSCQKHPSRTQRWRVHDQRRAQGPGFKHNSRGLGNLREDARAHRIDGSRHVDHEQAERSQARKHEFDTFDTRCTFNCKTFGSRRKGPTRLDTSCGCSGDLGGS
jgi:pSer/pThr/pTyr-binding forkhead associated (FHA) protein